MATLFFWQILRPLSRAACPLQSWSPFRAATYLPSPLSTSSLQRKASRFPIPPALMTRMVYYGRVSVHVKPGWDMRWRPITRWVVICCLFDPQKMHWHGYDVDYDVLSDHIPISRRCLRLCAKDKVTHLRRGTYTWGSLRAKQSFSRLCWRYVKNVWWKPQYTKEDPTRRYTSVDENYDRERPHKKNNNFRPSTWFKHVNWCKHI